MPDRKRGLPGRFNRFPQARVVATQKSVDLWHRVAILCRFRIGMRLNLFGRPCASVSASGGHARAEAMRERICGAEGRMEKGKHSGDIPFIRYDAYFTSAFTLPM